MATDVKRTTTIKLGHDGDEIRVNPSVEVDGSVTIHLTDSQEIRPCVGIASPPEWDAFVAAGDRALGRVSNDRCADIAMAYHRAYMRGKISYTQKVLGRRESFKIAVERAALAMVREQGPTVPRAGVAAVVAEIDALECEDDRAIAGIRASLAALLAAPATQTEKG